MRYIKKYNIFENHTSKDMQMIKDIFQEYIDDYDMYEWQESQGDGLFHSIKEDESEEEIYIFIYCVNTTQSKELNERFNKLRDNIVNFTDRLKRAGYKSYSGGGGYGEPITISVSII